MEGQTTMPAKRRLFSVFGLAGLVLVLAAAAYVGGEMMAGKNILKGSPRGFRKIPAPELPTGRSEVSGLFVRQQDNSLFVGTGNVTIHASGFDPATQRPTGLTSSHDGPVVEVVVTPETIVYNDVTRFPFGGEGGTVQQEVRQVDRPEGLNQYTSVEAWGQRSGDRVIARVLVYHVAGE